MPLLELLPPTDYASLEPLLAACGVPDLDLAAESTKDWARIWVLRDVDTGALSAFVLVWWLADQVEVVHIATSPAARRRGLARHLLEHLLTQMRAARIPTLWLEVRRSNAPAVNLYRALGFVVSRERKRYYADGEDALEMSLEVSPA